MDMKGFMCSEEHLRDLLEKIESGVEPMMTDLEKIELKKYIKMQESELFGDDEGDDVLTEDEKEYRERVLKQSLEEAKRKARKTDVAVIRLSGEQKDQLREEMSSSLVRPNPNTLYNKSQDELYQSAEERIISEKIKRARNCYYDPAEWIAVINNIKAAIELELKSDKYIFLGNYEKRVQAFNEGKIKLKMPLPKLYLNRVTPVTDPEMLKGIMSGDVEVVDRVALDVVKKKSYKDSPLVPAHMSIIGEAEHDWYAAWHRKGYETPISPAIRAKSTIYNRYITPTERRHKAFGITDKNGVPIIFDWEKDSPTEYFRQLHGLKTTAEDIVEDVKKNNGGKVNKVLLERMNKFFQAYKQGGLQVEDVKPNWISSSLNVNPTVVKMEQDLLRSIQLNSSTSDT
jgi:hypothetical protein